MQETWVWFLGQEDPLEMEMATHSCILAWRILWTEEPVRLQPMGSKKLNTFSDLTIEDEWAYITNMHRKRLACWDLCFNTSQNQFVVLEKTLVSPLDCKEIQPVNPKGNQPLIFIGRTDGKAEAPILWPPEAKSWLIGKDPDAGKDWGQEEKGMTEGEMVGWHHRLDGHEFEQAPGDGDGQGGLACCIVREVSESDTTEQLNWTELKVLKLKL